MIQCESILRCVGASAGSVDCRNDISAVAAAIFSHSASILNGTLLCLVFGDAYKVIAT